MTNKEAERITYRASAKLISNILEVTEDFSSITEYRNYLKDVLIAAQKELLNYE